MPRTTSQSRRSALRGERHGTGRRETPRTAERKARPSRRASVGSGDGDTSDTPTRRAFWKGRLSLGLVEVPVRLRTACAADPTPPAPPGPTPAGTPPDPGRGTPLRDPTPAPPPPDPGIGTPLRDPTLPTGPPDLGPGTPLRDPTLPPTPPPERMRRDDASPAARATTASASWRASPCDDASTRRHAAASAGRGARHETPTPPIPPSPAWVPELPRREPMDDPPDPARRPPARDPQPDEPPIDEPIDPDTVEEPPAPPDPPRHASGILHDRVPSASRR